MPASGDGVFINVPFDRRYKKLFDALVYAVHDCGFVARGAREQEDGSEVRLSKLYKIIDECRYGIHDLSIVEDLRANGAASLRQLAFALNGRTIRQLGEALGRQPRCTG